jgi:hypothetical protein
MTQKIVIDEVRVTVTDEQLKELKDGIIFWCSHHCNYYHIECGKTWDDVNAIIKTGANKPLSEGELYQKARHIHELVPTNETEDNNFIPFRNILDEAKADFSELLNVRLFNLKYGPSNIDLWNQDTLKSLGALYQVKTIEKIKKWFGSESP